MQDRVARWLVWHMPRRLVYWAAIRLAVDATTGNYSTQEVPALTVTDALQRWRI